MEEKNEEAKKDYKIVRVQREFYEVDGGSHIVEFVPMKVSLGGVSELTYDSGRNMYFDILDSRNNCPVMYKGIVHGQSQGVPIQFAFDFPPNLKLIECFEKFDTFAEAEVMKMQKEKNEKKIIIPGR